MATMGDHWRPVLEGGDAERARQAIAAIAGELERVHAIAPLSPRLYDGLGGVALLHAYAGGALGEPEHGARCEAVLDELAERAGELVAPNLFGGLAGLGWLFDHVGVADAAEEIEVLVLELLERSPWTAPYDLVLGLVGYARFALDRPRSAGARLVLARVRDRLEELASRDDDGIAWLTPPVLLSEGVRAEYPAGLYDLGLAHGMAGVLAVACEAAVIDPSWRALVEGITRWMVVRTLPDGGFPELVDPSGVGTRRRPGWCNSELGIAIALLASARTLDDASLRGHALRVLTRIAARAGEREILLDDALCHGHAGLGLALARAAHETGEPGLSEAARRAFVRVLDDRVPGRGVGGYEAHTTSGPPEADPGLQTGAAGIALALTAALGIEPRWDRLFLLSGGA
jgi:lantibiotic biosynthesis protein